MSNSQIFNRFSKNLLNLEIPIKTIQSPRAYYPGQSIIYQGKTYTVRDRIDANQRVILIGDSALPQQPNSQKETSEKVLLNRHTSGATTYKSNTICPNVVWFKGGAGPPPPPPPEEIPENATGTLLSVRGFARRWLFNSVCGSNQTTLQSIVVPGYIPRQRFRVNLSDPTNLCGFTTWGTATVRNSANTITITVAPSLTLPNWAGWIPTPIAFVTSYLYDFPPPAPPTDEEVDDWFDQTDWNYRTFDERITANFINGKLVVRSARNRKLLYETDFEYCRFIVNCNKERDPDGNLINEENDP